MLDLPAAVTTVTGTLDGPLPRSGTVTVQEVCDVQLVPAWVSPKYATTSPLLLNSPEPSITMV